jgi:serine/threonine protein kinase
MAEQQPERNQPEEQPDSMSSPPGPGGEACPGSREASDDAPTIISRPAKRTAPRPEEAFPVNLRGRHLAHFELIEAIGVGGMAAVIRARDTQLDRSIALKILPPEMAADVENVRRFHHEARAAAKLDHENIARVYFCGEDQGLHFIAFEFVEGENLRTLLERRGRIPVAEAVHYILQIATGLAHSSGRGVVHRDIKPSNIIISGNGRAKLVDMGLARSLEPHTDPGLTQSGVTLGTFDYISPEQALEPREADVRSDIYSLGCTFYHMLTGRPPVPEGTAAKKLHHHQHVAPIDPRQLNPEIPDEVAAVLARMMVKDPKYRYQKAEHLVQHLIQLAHQLGAAPDLADGVLFVDTPLPSPPRLRPLAVTVAALFVLIALVVLHGMAPWTTPVPSPAGQTKAKDSTPEAKSGTTSPETSSPLADPAPQVAQALSPGQDTQVVAATVKELADCLGWATTKTVSEVRISHPLDLTQEALEARTGSVQGLVVQGKNRPLTIQPEDAGRQTIRLKYHPDLRYDGLTTSPRSTPASGVGAAPDSQVWTALTIKGGHVTLKRLRFEVDATQAPVLMAAIKLQDGATVTLEECEFVQVDPPRTDALVDGGRWTADGGLSSLVVENGHAILKACYFGTVDKTGQASGTVDNHNAVTLLGPATVQAMNCAFGPHTVLFHLRKGQRPETDLTLDHCSALLEDASVFKLDEGVTGRVVVRNSLFSCPDSPGTVGHTANLIQQTGGLGGNPMLRYEGNDNRYHHLGKFWLIAGAQDPSAGASIWNDFLTFLRENNQGSDSTGRVLTTSPWAAKDPLQLLKKNELANAFRVNVRLPELRQVNNREKLVGVEVGPWGPSYPGILPDLEDKKPALVAKVVDPDKDQPGEGSYATLSKAVEYAKPGDVILIKANGPLPIKPVRLDKATDDLTIKPFEGFHPVLTLGETSDRDATLFRVRDGKLKLEGLEFSLHPSSDEFTTQAVVDLTGDGRCEFQDCVATLEDSHGKPFALVLVTDPSRFMKMEPTPQPQEPWVQVRRCFVRGQGDLVAVRATRPLNLEVDNSLVALAGSFLNVEGNSRTPPGANEVKVGLNQITAFLSDHLIRLRAGKEGEEPVPVRIKAQSCLFASAESHALVHLDGMELTPEQMEHAFQWRNGRHNAYHNFQPMLDQQPKGDEMPLPSYNQQSWKKFTGEMDATFPPPMKLFAEPPVPEIPLVQHLIRALPTHFKVKMDGVPTGFGAEVEQLPKPFLDTAAK